MNVLKGAEEISRKSVKEIQKNWKYIKGGQSCVMSFLRAYCPEDFEEIGSGAASIKDIVEQIQKNQQLAANLQEYAKILKASYAPIFRFRDSLFANVKVYDPHHLLLDEVGETDLDPIHLLRFYEFESNGERIEVTSRAEEPYSLAFSLQIDDLEEFKNIYLSKLFAFANCSIRRMQGGNTRPTELPVSLRTAIKETLIPGVIVSQNNSNSWVIARLKKQGLDCYPIHVSSYTSATPKEYTFLPNLSGILAIASGGIALKCPDEEEFWVV